MVPVEEIAGSEAVHSEVKLKLDTHQTSVDTQRLNRVPQERFRLAVQPR